MCSVQKVPKLKLKPIMKTEMDKTNFFKIFSSLFSTIIPASLLLVVLVIWCYSAKSYIS